MVVEVPTSLFAPDVPTIESNIAETRSNVDDGDEGVPPSTNKGLQTIGDAVEFIDTLVDKQIALALELNSPPNVAIVGDAAARTTFYTILPDEHQRLCFLRVAGQMRAWPRLRSLFGAPPYGFLHAEDGGVIRAAGIAAHRQNMTHHEAFPAASYSQFGSGQLVDDSSREYRVVARKNDSYETPLPFDFANRNETDVVLQVRIQRRSRAKKIEILKDSLLRQTVLFPRPGDRIILHETKRILALQNKKRPTHTSLTVKRLVLRDVRASTAALVCRLES